VSRSIVSGSHKIINQPIATLPDPAFGGHWFTFYAYYTFKGYQTFKVDTA